MNLSPRELQVLALVATGASDKEIGSTLRVSFGTVKSHMASIRMKLKAKNRTHAAVIYLRAQGEGR